MTGQVILNSSNLARVSIGTNSRVQVTAGESSRVQLTSSPRGLPGPKGDTGPRGLTGASGTPGSSAYAIAVSNGFVGSQTAWLDSLKFSLGPDISNVTVLSQLEYDELDPKDPTTLYLITS